MRGSTKMGVILAYACFAVANSLVTHFSPRAFTRNLSCQSAAFDTAPFWNAGLSFGKGNFKFYKNFDSWMSVFTQKDRDAFPEIFQFPPGVYEVGLTKPLGIVFEETEDGPGVYVKELVEGGLAARQGRIQPGDILVGVTAVKVVGAKWERRMIPARNFDFDTTVGAIQSNDSKFGCQDVILMFKTPNSEGFDPERTKVFLDFFEPPWDNPWKVG
jgi:hypothetical protein